MKHYSHFPASRTSAALLLLAFLARSHTFANSVIAGGYVPERRNFTVTDIRGKGAPGLDGSEAVAVIEIDNNLPDFQMTLHFHPLNGDGGTIETVRLESLEGKLGRGLDDPSGEPLTAGAEPGQFIWNPGPQKTATLGFRVRVWVTYKRPVAETTPLSVSMHLPY